jgi:DNA-binding MarR family transcriptional regulator
MSDMQAGEKPAADWLVGPEDEIAALVMWLARQLTAHVGLIAAPFNLTEPQALLIRGLRQPVSMRLVADHMQCDASNLTGIVDRLEARGLVERCPVPTDRRVKELRLTAAGREIQAQLDEQSGHVPELSILSADEQQLLLSLLRRVLISVRSGP